VQSVVRETDDKAFVCWPISCVHPHSLRECAPSLPRTPRVARYSSEMERGCGRLEVTPPARHDTAGRKRHSIPHPAETAMASPECHQSHILIDRAAACWGHPSTQSCASSAGTPPRHTHHPAHPPSLQRCLTRHAARHGVPHTLHQPSYRRHASRGAVGGRGGHRALRLQSYVSIRGTPYVPNRVFIFEKKSCSVY
jgi:hypothetical protein